MKKKGTGEKKRIAIVLLIMMIVSFTSCANPFAKETGQGEKQQAQDLLSPTKTEKYFQKH